MHTPHPSYFGLFNPAPTTMGIAADTLVAAFNPQLAAWSHSPFAVEAERYVIETFAAKFGLPHENVEGTFTSGGMEANHTALLTALVHHFPTYLERGARGIDKQPVMYVSSESHHSLLKAARLCGIGSEAVRRIGVDEHLRMRSDLLRAAIAEDRRKNNAPFLIAATAGATNSGVVDDLAAIAQVALRRESLVSRGCGLGRSRQSSFRNCGPNCRASSRPIRSPSMRINGFPSRWEQGSI